jgi:alkylation response protein AidB-like acyl-CoA dehydrogenase
LRQIARPAAVELDKLSDPQDVIKPGSIFWDVFRKHYELERHLVGLPEEFGGANLTGLDMHIVAEEMGWAPPTSRLDWAPADALQHGAARAQMTAISVCWTRSSCPT